MTRSGTVWVIALLSMPLVGLLVGSSLLVNWTDDSWQWRNIAWIALGAGVPLACGLVHTRKLGVIILTLLVGLTTYPAIRHLVTGAAVADTTITAIDCNTHERRGTRCIEERLTLGDGRAVVLDASRARGFHAGERVHVSTLDGVALSVAPSP